MVKLKWLQIERFRQAAPCRLEFSDGFNVLLGRNGTGKTNLLKLIAMIVRGDFSALSREECSFSYLLEAGGWTTEFTIELHMDSGTGLRTPHIPPRIEHESFWTWEAHVRTKSERELRVAGSSRGPLHIDGTDGGRASASPLAPFFYLNALIPFWTAWLEDRPARIGVLAQMYNGGRFDEALALFHAITGAAEHEPAEALPFPSTLFFNASETDVGGPISTNPVLVSVPQGYAPLVRPVLTGGEPSVLTVSSAEWPLLEDIASRVGFSAATIVATQHGREVGGDGQSMSTYGRFTFHFALPDGSIINQDQLSFGQKRFLSFLWYLACNEQGVIIADELVNGLHHAWIEHAMHAIPPRQAFLASQNPLLFDFLTFESAEEVRKTFILCDLEEGERRRKWRWHAMDEDAADGFFRAYEAGFQHVSELLETKGIW